MLATKLLGSARLHMKNASIASSVEFHLSSNNYIIPSSVRCDLLRTHEEDATDTSLSKTVLPSQAKVVICGGGVVGASVAYHLALHDWTDVVLIEQGRLGGGSTGLAAGLLGQLKQSTIETRLCQYSVNLYKSLEEQGLKTGWKECGSLSLARTKDRMISFQRQKSLAKYLKLECEILSPQEISQLCPLLKVEDLQGGLWTPGDGVGNPYETCQTLASEAMKKGIKIVEGGTVDKVLTKNDKVVAVETNYGTISCEYFVNCAGFWARELGRKSEPRVKVPLHPCEHYYLHTKLIDGLDHLMPVIRDYDGFIYFRENEGRILAGGFEPVAKPIFHEGLSGTLTRQHMQEDWDHFYVLLEQMLHRIPSLGEAILDKLFNGPECFSPDCKWIVGEAPEVKNYFVATGMKTIGIVAAGGVGKITADWIVSGAPQDDVCQLDLQRFLGLHNNRKFLRDRMHEVPGLHYKLSYPHQEFQTGRNLRMSPIYPRLRAAGAVFGQTMGYERPTWFETLKEGKIDLKKPRIAETNTFYKPPWFEYMKAEYKVCREGVALLDYSSFTKLELKSKGTEVVDFLQVLCSNNVDIPVGSVIHTGMQNHNGGYENDCSLARISENHYLMISPTIQQTRCKSWIKSHLPPDSSVTVTDVTSMYTAICVMGPLSRHLLAEVTDSNMSTSDFPFFTFKELNVCLASGIRVMNLTHTGELGWVLYIPSEHALHVYDGLIEFGQKYNIQHAGYYAMRTLRIERFYAFWGQDLDTTTTPLECGRAFRVKFNYDKDFIGKKALLHQREEGVKRKYVQLLLENHDNDKDPWPWGGEPVFRDDQLVGITKTTCYGFTLGKQVCLGFVQQFDENGVPQVVTNDYVLKGNYEVEVAGQRFPAKVNLHSPKIPLIEVDVGLPEQYMATQLDIRQNVS